MNGRGKNEGGYQWKNKLKYLKFLRLKERKLKELLIDGPNLSRKALDL